MSDNDESEFRPGDQVLWGESGAGKISYLSLDGTRAYIVDLHGQPCTIPTERLIKRTNRHLKSEGGIIQSGNSSGGTDEH